LVPNPPEPQRTALLNLTPLAGEYIATKSQNQVLAADLKIEREEHFKYHREVEEMQV